MYLTRHKSLRGPRWALDGNYLSSGFRLGSLLELLGNIVPKELEHSPTREPTSDRLLPPVDPTHEIWACEGTYADSLEAAGRAGSELAEARESAYEAERPELFLKAVGWRTVGHHQPIRTRYDSYRSVPEAELVLVLNQHLEIVGYTAGIDVTARDIEGENPLYLPQAKFYDDSCSLGPGIMITSPQELEDVSVELHVQRGDTEVFGGSTETSDMRRRFSDVLEYMGRELDFPDGALLMTGSGITLPDDFALQPGDKVRSVVGELTLENEVAESDSAARLAGWSYPRNGLRYRALRR